MADPDHLSQIRDEPEVRNQNVAALKREIVDGEGEGGRTRSRMRTTGGAIQVIHRCTLCPAIYDSTGSLIAHIDLEHTCYYSCAICDANPAVQIYIGKKPFDVVKHLEDFHNIFGRERMTFVKQKTAVESEERRRQADIEILELRTELDKTLKDAANFQNQAQQLHYKNLELAQELEGKHKERSELEGKVLLLETELKELHHIRGINLGLRKELLQKQVKVSELQGQVLRLESDKVKQLQTSQAKTHALQVALQRKFEAVAELNCEISELKGKVRELQKLNDGASSAVMEYSTLNNRLQERIVELETKVNSLEESVARKEPEPEENSTQFLQMAAQVDNLKQRVQQLLDEKDEHFSDRRKLVAENSELRLRFQELAKENRDYKRMLAPVLKLERVRVDAVVKAEVKPKPNVKTELEPEAKEKRMTHPPDRLNAVYYY